MKDRTVTRLRGELARNHQIAEGIRLERFPMAELARLQQWQRARLAQSFADLVEDPGSTAACQFFLSELYGGLDFIERDQEVSRVMPVMTRFLPEKALQSMADAFELQALSLELDISMAEALEREGKVELDLARYARVYRKSSDREQRERQIELIRQLGHDMKRLVRKPLVNSLVKLMHAPAHAAGFGELQDFLERGLGSFRSLDNPDQFIETIYEREWRSMERLFAGDPEPFSLNSR